MKKVVNLKGYHLFLLNKKVKYYSCIVYFIMNKKMIHPKMDEKKKLMYMLEHREKMLTKRLTDVRNILTVLKSQA
jgi:hypothetical protein